MDRLLQETSNFVASARWVCGLVAQIDPDAWDTPALGDWDLRALVGHTSRALLTVEQYLREPAEAEDVTDAAGYFEAVAALPGAGPGTVFQRGVDAGEALGADPATSILAIARRAEHTLDGADDRLIATIAGCMRLSNYLTTRTFELVVHGLDIARAAGLASEPPRAALGQALRLAAELAARGEDAAPVLFALTGRGTLGPGFSVLG